MSRVPSPSRSSLYSLRRSYDVFELLQSGAEHLKRQELGNGEWQKVVSMPNRAQHVIWQYGVQPHAFSRSAMYANYGQIRASVTLSPIALR